MRFYLALDGDVSPAERCAIGATLGKDAQICCLPAGKDPDDLTGDELQALKSGAVGCLDAWLGLLQQAQGEALKGLRRSFAEHLARWVKDDPGCAGELRGRVCAGMQMSPEEYDAWLGLRSKPTAAVQALYPGQPEPIGPPPKGDDVKILRNWILEDREQVAKDGSTKTVKTRISERPDQIRANMLAVTGGWPLRIYAPSAKFPLLFTDSGSGDVEIIQTAAAFQSWLKRYSQVQFAPGSDHDGTNHFSIADLFEDMASAKDVQDFLNIEIFPHEPSIPGHYYAWRPPDGYQPDGRHILEFLEFFNNLEGPESKAIFFSVILTLYWGGHYGTRPLFLFEAKRPGSGKSTMAQMLAELVGPDDSKYIKVSFGQQRQEEQLNERLLSPSALKKRVVLWDNARGNLQNVILESLITDTHISGKRMYQGEGSRPNSLIWIVTLNNAKCNADLARRSFRVGVAVPARNAGWRTEVIDYIRKFSRHIAADAMAILRMPVQPVDFGKVVRSSEDHESFDVWSQQVLARGVAYLGQRIGLLVGVEEVLSANCAWRGERDTDVAEAEELMEGLLQRICDERQFGQQLDILTAPKDPVAVWISSKQLMAYWQDIFEQELNSVKTLVQIVENHIQSGRCEGLTRQRSSGGQQGFRLSQSRIEAYLLHRAQLKAEESEGSEGKTALSQARA